MLISSLVSFALSIINNETFIDSIIIIAIAIINAWIGYFQEEKSNKEIEALKYMQAHNVKVQRDGKVVIIDSKNIVVDDILLLDAGYTVSFDAWIVSSSSLKVGESVLDF